MREAYGTTFVSRFVEFQAFTAAVTLLLGLLGTTSTTNDPVIMKEQQEDQQLVETVVQVLERLYQYGTNVQGVSPSISVIRTLQDILRNEGNSSGNVRLTIQHFGTISVARGGTVQSLEGERILGANPRSTVTSMEIHPLRQAGQSSSTSPATGAGPSSTSTSVPRGPEYQSFNDGGEAMTESGAWMNNTLLQFTSSQFPTFEAQPMDSAAEWQFSESDVMLFDSLLNTDVEGNWDF